MSIFLRELTHEDVKTINVWRNDKNLVDGFIGEKRYQGNGYGTLAILKILEPAFCNLNLDKVFGFFLEENIRSINVAKKCGLGS